MAAGFAAGATKGRILAERSLLAIGYEAITEPVLDLGELGLAGDTLVAVDLTDRTVAVQGEINVGEHLGVAEEGLLLLSAGNRNNRLSCRAVWLTLP